VERARRHQRLFAGLALALLALAAELAGRSLTERIDLGRHVGPVSYRHADYYPFLLAAVKVGIALTLARVTWRFVKARAAARAAHRVSTALGVEHERRAPRVRIELSPRLWLAAFVATSVLYLVQADGERGTGGALAALGPWLHSSSLPVFAVLSVLVAVLFRSVERWLNDYEQLASDPAQPRRRRPADVRTPRSLFGLAFESRPPPAPAS
jgi:hypothetical protein